MKKPNLLFISASILLSANLRVPAQVPPTMTYHGRILVSGTNFTGNGQFKFAIINGINNTTYWSNDGTSTVGSQPVSAVIAPAQEGLVTIILGDSSLANMTPIPVAALAQSNTRLRIWFNDGVQGFAQLTPDRPLTSVPYAMIAATVPVGAIGAPNLASQSVTTDKLAVNAVTSTRIADGAVTSTKVANGAITAGKVASGAIASTEIANGSITASDVNAQSLGTLFWRLDGNGGTTAGANFLGTTDVAPLELRVNGTRGLRLEPGAAVNVIGGGPNNVVTSSGVGSGIVAGRDNQIAGDYSAIVGGVGNDIGVNGDHCVIGGGESNKIAAGSSGSMIGAGERNNAGPNAFWTVIAGGLENKIEASSRFSTIGGGSFNNIGTNTYRSVIGGGDHNSIGAESEGSVISGGGGNVMGTNSNKNFIGGGGGNNIAANSSFCAIAGGLENAIGTNSRSFIGCGWGNVIAPSSADSVIAGGFLNDIGTNSDRSFIGAGDQNAIGTNSPDSLVVGGFANVIGASSSNSFIGGGRYHAIGPNAPFATIAGGDFNYATNRAFAAGTWAKALHSGAFVWGDATINSSVVSTNANSVTMRATGGYRLLSGLTPTTGVYLAPGGGAWTSLSDRNAKENLRPVDSRAVLDKVAALRVTTWNYKSQTNNIRHIGPMAQDFKAAFGVGESDTGITTVDADGVALAAIQGLNQKLEQQLKEKEGRIEALERTVAELKQVVARLVSVQDDTER